MEETYQGKNPEINPAASRLVEAAWAQSPLRFYRENPFRVLGLSVLASGREVAKRMDELRLAHELNLPVPSGSFAPPTPWSIDQARAASQSLQDPSRRILAELFWFWPASYPDSGDDEALDRLKAGQTDDAVAIWAGKKTADHPDVLHNLAVYHHLMAIEQEQALRPISPEDLSEWWGATVRFWQLAAENEGVWDRLGKRIAQLEDAQLSLAAVAPLRAELPNLLSAVNAAFAVQCAAADNGPAAARHLAVLGQIHTETDAARKSIERALRPALKRINALLDECAQKASSNPRAGGEAARMLIERSIGDIRIVNTLCGAESELAADVTTRLAVTVLDALERAKEATGEAAHRLVLLILVRSFHFTGPISARLKDVFAEHLDLALAPTGEEAGEPGYAQLFRLVSTTIIPDLHRLEVPENIRREAGEGVAELLRRVAREAVAERDDIAFAMHALETLTKVPNDAAGLLRMEAERHQFHREFMRRKEKEIRLESMTDVFAINLSGIVWNDHRFTWLEVSAIRYGRVSSKENGERKENMHVEWQAAEKSYLLNLENFFGPSQVGAGTYPRVVEALLFFATPPLVARVVTEVLAGGTFWIGQTGIAQDGVMFESKSRLWKKEERVALSRLNHWSEGGMWIIASLDNPKMQAKYSIVDTWNAAIAGAVIDALAAKPEEATD